MKIVLATFGSLGDLHPMIAIGIELRRRLGPAKGTDDRLLLRIPVRFGAARGTVKLLVLSDDFGRGRVPLSLEIGV